MWVCVLAYLEAIIGLAKADMEEVIVSVYYMLEGREIYIMYFFYIAWGLTFHLFRAWSAYMYVVVSS